MDYPSLPLLATSAPKRNAGYQARRATNGRLVRRRFYVDSKWDFELTHWLTEAQYLQLSNHYEAHKDASFAFTWPDDGQARTVGYTEAPLPTRSDGYVLVTVKLSQI